MSKNLEELRQEYAENEAKLRQYQHRAQRLAQRQTTAGHPNRL